MARFGKTGMVALLGPTTPSPPRGESCGRFAWLLLLLLACGPLGQAAEPTPSLERAAALRADGKLDEALDVLRTASREVKKTSGEDSPTLLSINELAAAILIDKGDLDTAEPLLTKAVAARQKLVDAGRSIYTPELVSAVMTLARLQADAKRFPDAAATVRRALLIEDRTAGPDSPTAASMRTTLDSVLDSLDDFLGPSDKTAVEARDEAASTLVSLGWLRAAVDQRKKVLAALRSRGNASAESCAAAERLCRLMMAAGLAAEAIPIADEAAKQAVAALPDSHSARRLVGELQLADGRLIDADASFKAVADSIQATKGATPLASSNDRLHHLLVDVRRGRVSELPAWFEAELKMLGSVIPADRDTAAAAVATAADVLAVRGDHAAAAELFARAAALAASAKTPSAATAADLSGRLGAALIAAGKPAAAFDTCKAALAAAEQKLGPGDPTVALLRIVLADVLRHKGEKDAARKMLADALVREVPRPDDDREAVIVGVVDAVATARPDEPIRDLFVQARERQFGVGHRHVGMAWNLFAASRLAAGDWPAAADFLDRALAIELAGLGPDHPDVAATTSLLAYAQLAAGDAARATASATKAVDAWERLAGASHPGTLAAVEVLARARLRSGERAAAESLFERLRDNGPKFSDVKQADHLVSLAMLALPHDRGRAEESLARITDLACWLPEGDVPPQDRPAMAITAARVAYAFKRLDQGGRAAEAVRKARSWASTSENSTALLDQVERVAEAGDLPPDS